MAIYCPIDWRKVPILAYFHFSGKTPDTTEDWRIFVRGVTISSVHSFTIRALIWSVPHALLGLIVFSAAQTAASDTDRYGSHRSYSGHDVALVSPHVGDVHCPCKISRRSVYIYNFPIMSTFSQGMYIVQVFILKGIAVFIDETTPTFCLH